MAEEKKEGCGCQGGGLKSLVKVVIGIALIVLGVFLCIQWLPALLTLVKGCLGPFLVLLGLIFIAIAKE